MVRPLPPAALPLIAVLSAVLVADLLAIAGEPPPLPDVPSGWGRALAHGLAACSTAVLLWRHQARARMAAYVFFTVDALRTLRHGQPLSLGLDLAAALYLQAPVVRALYPSMWSRTRAWRRHGSVG